MQTEEWRESDWVKNETLFPKREKREGGKEERGMKMEEGEGEGRGGGERELTPQGTYLFILKK